jgi:HemY protein
MIRVALYLIVVGLIALGIAWFADRPGDVTVTWLGMRIETSVMMVLVALAAILAAAIFLWAMLRGLMRTPGRVSDFWQRRRSGQGHQAITRGLLAVGVGDAAAARRHAEDAARLAGGEPLALLLGAQAAQLSGDRAAAERSFRKMTEREETRLFGLRGLYVEAQRRDDAASAQLYAEEAARLDPALPWAGQAVLQFRSAAGDWTGALEALERNRRSGAAGKEDYRRQRAVLLTGQAMALEEADRDTAKAAALEAVKLAPGLVPAAALAARFLSEAGEIRKATRILEKAWQAQPHPDLADAYVHVRPGDAARERLARARRLAEKSSGEIEGALALARAAIDAREFVQARQALMPFLDQPTQRVALLMAHLEQAEFGDEGRARAWTARALRARRDPVWVADGFVSDRWLPLSPVSGRLDAFAWKVPLAGVTHDGPALDPQDEAPLLVEEKPAPVFAPADAEAGVKAEAKAETDADSAASSAVGARVEIAPVRPPAVAEEIVPAVPVPDDPGPDSDMNPERAVFAQPDAAPSGWRRFFSW